MNQYRIRLESRTDEQWREMLVGAANEQLARAIALRAERDKVAFSLIPSLVAPEAPDSDDAEVLLEYLNAQETYARHAAAAVSTSPAGDGVGDLVAPAVAAAAAAASPAADGTGDVAFPALAAGSALAAPAADGAADVPAPAVSGAGNANVMAAPCAAGGDLVAAAASGGGGAQGANVDAPILDATSMSPAPTVRAHAERATPTAAAGGDLPAPAGGAAATVPAAPILARGSTPVPALAADVVVATVHLDGGGDLVAPAVRVLRPRGPADSVIGIARPGRAGVSAVIGITRIS